MRIKKYKSRRLDADTENGGIDMESIISGCGKFNRSKDKDLIEARSALVQAWKDDVERTFEKVDKNLPDMMARHIAYICYRESEQLKKQITMERKIGEIFEYNGEWYQCVEGTGCYQCAFNRDEDTCTADNPDCTCRSDKKDVVFKKLEKVGEPMEFARGTYFQRYRLADSTVSYKGAKRLFTCEPAKEFVYIEIKQTKENMEEYRMHDAKEDIPEFDKVVDECLFGEDKLNLKPFDLEAAKAGKTVCTRDGRKARIICFDRKSETPITVLVTEINGIEAVYSYPNNGIWDSPENTNGCDLMMLPEKKEGWAVIRRNDIYETEEKAKEVLLDSRIGVMIRKVEWEE